MRDGGDYPDDRRYTPEGLWALIDGELATVGLSAYAQDAMGEIVYVELPQLGETIARGQPLGAVESVKAVVEPESPLSGEVVERNEEAYRDPALINRSCYEAGWLFRLRMAEAEEYGSLLEAAAYAESVG